MRSRLTFLLCLAVGGCVDYPNDHVPAECDSLEDCNPVRTCGWMVECVGGACDPARRVEVPCDTRCAVDGECVLADKGCCCGSTVDDYVAILQEDLPAWLARAECQGVGCPEIECMVPEGLRAVCQNRRCSLEVDPGHWDRCEADSDCVKVPVSCPSCDCHAGYEEFAVNRQYQQIYLDQLDAQCATMGACATGPYGVNACTNRPPVCRQGRCSVLGEGCGCPEHWNPVCTRVDDVRLTFPNACQTECLGLEWFYHGRCNCEAACLDPSPVCATNGVTYWCGEEEARCSGNQVGYPGDCIAACEYCADVERPNVPVCGEDMRNYFDICYVECHGLDWWHEGDCLDGEGEACDDGSYTRIPCRGDDLFCLVDRYCPDCPGCECPGVCIALGHCMRPADCSSQPLPMDDCTGRWRCRDHSCLWECD